ncbi:Alpha/Beta hydrolase protein, partial [Mycena epipterygia]
LPSGHTWAFVDANPAGSPTLLCLHGFPDLALGYRHQIGAWARAGFRVVVPDMLGYGGSDAPVDPAQYTTKRLSADLAALLTALAVPRAVVVGHDWGSFTAGRFALWQPERVLALVVMSVPYTPPSRRAVTLADIVHSAPNLAYQLFLAGPDAAPRLEAQLPRFLALTYQPPHSPVDFTAAGALRALLDEGERDRAAGEGGALPCLLTGRTLAAYLAAFRARGMTGPTNYYRTALLRALEEIAASSPSSSSSSSCSAPTSSSPASSPSTTAPTPLTLPPIPVLSIHGTLDATLAPAALLAQRRTIPRLSEVVLEGVGHWVMVQDGGDSDELLAD